MELTDADFNMRKKFFERSKEFAKSQKTSPSEKRPDKHDLLINLMKSAKPEEQLPSLHLWESMKNIE
jgi:hypothetical protein